METNFVSWNPSTRAQLISYSPGKLQLLEFSDDQDFNREIRQVHAWEANQVQCLAWRSNQDCPVFAYGTSTGLVQLVNVQSGEEAQVSQGARLGKRCCNAVSWNKHMPSQLVAGFDNLKSEFCAAVWDFEHEHFMHASFGESACSISWLPDNAHSLAVGTNMGWVKVYDTRASSQVGAACSVLAHPAPRPRKIRGIRPDPFRPHLFATYSDFAGDVVKVWDLRKVSTPATKANAVVPPSFVVVPSLGAPVVPSTNTFTSQFASTMTGEAEAVVDVAWSTARAGVMAVATSARRSVSFFSTSTVSGSSNMPIYSVNVPAPVQVHGLTWQSGGSGPTAAEAELAGHAPGTGAGAPNSPLHADRKSILASMSAASGPQHACWENFRSDDELRGCGYSALLKASPVAHPLASAVVVANSHTALPHPRLLVAIAPESTEASGGAPCYGFAEVEVLDRVPLAISCAGGLLAVNTARGRTVALGSRNVGRVPCSHFSAVEEGVPLAAQCYRFTDVGETMRQRCLAGYSADAYTNLEVLAEELDAVYAAAAHMTAAEVQKMAPAVANTKAVYRTWAWMDRFETSVTADSNLTVANCGILEMLVFNQRQHAASNIRQGVRHPVLGAGVFSSEGRETAKKLCGWIKMFGMGKTPVEVVGAASRSSSESVVTAKPVAGRRAESIEDAVQGGGGAEDDLLEVIVEELFQDSFERAAAIALWHGRIDLAVVILRRAIANMEDTKTPPPLSPERHDSKSRTRSGDFNDDGQTRLPKVLWDAPYAPGYLQTVSLVAMCLAGYHYPAFAQDARPSSPGKMPASSPHSSKGTSAAATWASMCRHVIAQLQLSRREATSYLVAACRFLLANVAHSDPLCAEDLLDSSPAKLYADIVNEPRLTLEDRVAFACTYLGNDEVVTWLEEIAEAALAGGCIDAVLLMGLTDEGMRLLQSYLDRYDDVQTVALLVSRVIDSQQGQDGADGTQQVGTKSGTSEERPAKEWVWLHEYRNLLNKWEMFIERAYLDVELGKRYRRKAAMLGAQADKSAASRERAANAAGAAKRGGGSKGGAGSAAGTGISGGGGQGKGKAGRVLYRLPVHSDYPHFYLRCTYCGVSLPVDGMQNVRPNQLRVQNNVLSCCASCSKQLPRCYICQLYMGMVNPYLELLREMTQQRIVKERLSQQQSCPAPLSPARGGDADDASAHSGAKDAEQNSISFGKWFFFCQHCRHGGHANCIDQWFGGPGNVCVESTGRVAGTTNAADGSVAPPVRRMVCGVNGCDCKCITKL